MKLCAIPLFVCLFFWPQLILGQDRQPIDRPLIFADFQANAGTGWGLHMGLARIFRGRHEIGLAYEAVFTRATQYPNDFECPSCKHGFGNN